MQVIVIEGDSCSGKTTLAESLGYEVVHMDDFYLPLSKRSLFTRMKIGGNIDRRRFKREVLRPLKLGQPFDYGVFSHKTDGVSHTRHISNSGIVVVEGSYSLLPTFGRYYDYAVFLEVSGNEQIRRLEARGSYVSAFTEKWIPMEKRYHRKKRIKSKCFLSKLTG